MLRKYKAFTPWYPPLLVCIIFILNELRFAYSVFVNYEIILLIIIITGFCFLSFLLIQYFLKNLYKTSVICSYLVFFNLFYLDIKDFILSINIHNKNLFYLTPHVFRYLLSTFLVTFILLAIYLKKSKKGFITLNSYLIVVFSLFIGIEVFKWTFLPSDDIKSLNGTHISDSNQKTKGPNIYYIVLDSYTSSSSLLKYWNFNNSYFEDSLAVRGFYVVRNSRADYSSTIYCMPSYLNSTLYDFSTNDRFYYKSTQLVLNSKISKFLESHGYDIINFSMFNLGSSKKYYSFFFQSHLLGRSLWTEFVRVIKRYFYNDYYSIPNINMRIIQSISQISHNSKPFFLYAHIMMPHGPFHFTKDGDIQNNTEELDQDKYLEQVIFTNKLMVDLIDKILSKQKEIPIILIQGDHGYRYLPLKNDDDKEEEAYSIFNACLLPNGGSSLLCDTLRPINTFRIILNYYFQQSIPLCTEHVKSNEIPVFTDD